MCIEINYHEHTCMRKVGNCGLVSCFFSYSFNKPSFMYKGVPEG